MSRSFKKNPISPNTTSTSEKKAKRRWNKAFRQQSKSLVLRGAEPPVRIREVSDVWNGAKDGKRYRSSI